MDKCVDEIINAITDDLDKKYFVCSEYLINYNGVYSGKINENGYGNSAFIGEFGIFPEDDYFRTAYKDFNSAVKYFEKSGKGYKVYHLKEGMMVVLKNQQWIANEEDEVPELFFKLYLKYWEKVCKYANQFIPDSEKSSNLLNLASTLENEISSVK